MLKNTCDKIEYLQILINADANIKQNFISQIFYEIVPLFFYFWNVDQTDLIVIQNVRNNKNWQIQIIL